jgi:hypothetical protein
MTPANITNITALAIYKGAKWEHTLTFYQTGTTDPVDLSSLTFVLTFRHPTTKAFLFNGSATLTTDGTDGKVTLLATSAQTDALPLGPIRAGMRDNEDNAYMEGVLNVEYFSPDPD